jgi:hypothetical protein
MSKFMITREEPKNPRRCNQYARTRVEAFVKRRGWQLTREIVSLRGAGSEHFIVAAPVKPGLQTCIIHEVKPGYAKISDVKDALINVPAGVAVLLLGSRQSGTIGKRNNFRQTSHVGHKPRD